MCMKIWGSPKGRKGTQNPHTTSDEHSRYQPPGSRGTSPLFFPAK